MRRINSQARVTMSLLASVGAVALTGQVAAADVAPTQAQGSVTLNTMVLAVRNPSNELKIGKMTGTGSMDPVITQISPTQLIVADTASQTPNGNSGVQGMLTLVELTKNGPQVVGQYLVPRRSDLAPTRANTENGERVYMKPTVIPLDYQVGSQIGAVGGTALAAHRFIYTYATEDNAGENGGQAGAEGSNNGNPQTVAYVVSVDATPATKFATAPLNNKDGTTLPTGTLKLLNKVNMVSLTGTQDAQQYGAQSVVCNGSTCSIAMQRNNATTQIAAFTVNADGIMTQALPRRQYNANGQHSRPVFALGADARLMVATVDTNDQPAQNIKVWEFNKTWDATTKVTLKSTRIMQGIVTADVKTQVYVSRAYAARVTQLSDALAPATKAALELKSPLFTFAGVVTPVRNRGTVGGDNQNGHGGGGTKTQLMALDPDTQQPMGGTPLPKLDQLPTDEGPSAVRMNAANFGRHSSMLVANAFGAVGRATPAAMVLSAPSTGAAVGYAQFVMYDAIAGKFDVKANKNKFSLGFADIANQTKGKRNPNNQAGAFLDGVTSVLNPFYGDVTAKQPEVHSYAVVPVSGAFNITGDTADRSMGLRVSFIPQTWIEKYSVKPGDALPVESVPNGPAPVTPATELGAGTSGGDGPIGDPTGGGDRKPVDGASNSGDSGCSIGLGSSNTAGGFGFLGVGLAALALLRRKGSK